MITTKGVSDGASSSGRQAVHEASRSRIVPKPIPDAQAKDPRAYQIEQLRRRFSPKESVAADGTTSLSFKLSPSDPDFPFELDHLECELRVPAAYPAAAPTLSVRNKNIPRGFGINIEKGWDRLIEERRGATLLALTNALDRNLEAFLSEQKAETVKVTIFKDTRHVDSTKQDAGPAAPPPQPTRASRSPFAREESFTREQIAEAKARRAQEARQLEARMGKDPVYSRSSDGIVYTLPLEPRRRSDLPAGLQTVRSLQLIIPLLYPLQPVRVLLNDVDSKDAEGVEDLFVEKAAGQKQMSLMSHINYLAQNLGALAKKAQTKAAAAEAEAAAQSRPDIQAETSTSQSATAADAKSHIQVIPRPPEWSYAHGGGESSTSDSDGSYDSAAAESSDEDGGATISHQQQLPTATAERGTALLFPSLELHGVEILQITVLNITAKCARCKTINELTSLKPAASAPPKPHPCRKCAAPLTAVFRPELMHVQSARAGFLDLTACTAAELLPSTFSPTCEQCSSPAAPGEGLIAVRGDTTTNVCRSCHARFSFRLPEVKFATYTPGMSPASPPTVGPRRRAEDRLAGLRAGEPLPDRGACRHYRRSYRWFRFGCCGKVYPCDRCHDEAEGHENDWARRMVCGWCSREQRYAPDSCLYCGRGVVGKRATGFWEGGKGTRDRVLMRRGDRRKYRRTHKVEEGGKKD